jgi:hypothetical protein
LRVQEKFGFFHRLSGESALPEESTLWLHLRFGEARLLYACKASSEPQG